MSGKGAVARPNLILGQYCRETTACMTCRALSSGHVKPPRGALTQGRHAARLSTGLACQDVEVVLPRTRSAVGALVVTMALVFYLRVKQHRDGWQVQDQVWRARPPL